eukprot:5534588-Pleurochrysis_carterae.AAC.1
MKGGEMLKVVEPTESEQQALYETRLALTRSPFSRSDQTAHENKHTETTGSALAWPPPPSTTQSRCAIPTYVIRSASRLWKHLFNEYAAGFN